VILYPAEYEKKERPKLEKALVKFISQIGDVEGIPTRPTESEISLAPLVIPRTSVMFCL
jgi:hypothetical protein